MARTPNPFSGYTGGPSHNSIEPAGLGRGIPLNLLAQVIGFVSFITSAVLPTSTDSLLLSSTTTLALLRGYAVPLESSIT